VAILASELSTCYRAHSHGAAATLAPLAIQYADYAVWQHAQGQSAEQARQVAYWREQLHDAPPFLELPTDYPRPSLQTFHGDGVQHTIPLALVTQLQALSSHEGVTLFMTLLATFQLLLYRQTGQPDLVIGTPIANRNRSEVEGLIGFFVNTLAVRADLSGDPSFHELLIKTREVALGAYAHQDVSFDLLLAELNPTRDLSYSPIFQVMLNMIDVPKIDQNWGDLTVGVRVPLEIGAKVDMTLYLETVAEGMKLDLAYNSDLFTSARMAALLAQYAFLLEQVVAAPTQPLSHFTLVTPAARSILPDPTAPLSAQWEGAVHTLFAQHAAQNPEKIAVEDDHDHWSYHDLDARSNQLAHFFRQQGIATGDVVAIYAHRNASLVWAILGILKSGATYTILDTAYPSARLMDFVQQASPRGLVIIDGADPMPDDLLAQLTQTAPRCQITLPRLQRASAHDVLAGYPTQAADVVVGPDDIASITFTSGSTGRPKGILQRHGPLTHFLPWQQAAFGLNARDRYTMLSGLSHDPLQRDIFTPLCLGATICIPPPSEIGMPGWLLRWMQQEAITVTNLTPAMLQLVTQTLATDAPIALPELRYAFTVGDALKMHDVAQLWALAPNVTAVNMYGSTETQRAVGFYVIPRASASDAQPSAKEVIPLGQGLRDVQVLVCTPTLQLAGIGEIGEIFMRSPHLARGYLNNPTLTQERFITNPLTHDPADRWYRTGDLGRYLPDGQVEYIARNDQQVKIRGFRIELGEIEAVLKGSPTVQDAVVIASEVGQQEKHLIAYVVPFPAATHEKVIDDLRHYVATKLPMYMIPAAFVVLDAIPLTPNGKVNRPALPLPLSPAPVAVAATAPTTPLEAQIAQVWRDVLHRDQVGIFDNFFEVGGHSLLATQLVARLIEATGAAVTLRAIFESPTIASFASHLEQGDLPAARPKRPSLVPIARKPLGE
nr:amino acid adenylation domain-containing protein [Ktedonobacterales bacterium]